MLPRLTQYNAEHKYEKIIELSERALKIIIVTSVPITIGVICFSKDIVLIMFGKNFYSSILTMKIMAPFICITTIGNLFGTQLLMVLDHEKELFYSVMVGAVLNFSLNTVLIGKYNQNGAAMASVITELLVMIIQVWIVNRTFVKIRLTKQFVLSTVLMNSCMVLCLVICKKIFVQGITELIVSIVGASIIYVGIGYATKNTGILDIQNIVRNRRKIKG